MFKIPTKIVKKTPYCAEINEKTENFIKKIKNGVNPEDAEKIINPVKNKKLLELEMLINSVVVFINLPVILFFTNKINSIKPKLTIK